MALVNNQLVINNLDFDSAKQNFINWLSAQSEFSDYNFSGAGLQVLLDILAYNTHYNGFYYNMLSNEMTVSTAQVRDVILRHAKTLNYLPGSMTSAVATINITVTPPNGTTPAASLSIPTYTPFISQAVNGTNFNFVTTQTYTAQFDGTSYVFPEVEINEGNVVNFAYSAQGLTGNTFNIPNSNVDVTTLVVNVIETANTPSITLPYSLCSDISVLDGNTRVYFLSGADNSTYNLYFGDGILGRSLNGGDTVFLTYLNTNGPLANFANSFTIMNPIGDNAFSNVVVQSVSAAAGGSFAEDNASIKNHAPLSNVTQNRALTLQDYNEILLKNYKNISSLNIWSGATNNPPVYGQVMISIKPPLYNYLSQTQKQNVINLLSAYNMPTVGVTMVDADFTYITVNVEVNYNPKQTALSTSALISVVQNAIYNYATTQLGTFNGTFRESSLDAAIIAADPSILGCDTTIFLQKRFTPNLGQAQNYTLNYYTGLDQGSLNRSIFSTPAFTVFDSSGSLKTCSLEENIQAYKGVSEILINNPGFGYKGQPEVVIDGDGTGALAHAVVVNGAITQVVLDNPGINYSFASVSVVGGGGNGAVLTPLITAASGILETYYISNSSKFIINPNQGTIDYTNGVITLNNFAPVSIQGVNSQLYINAPPQRSLLLPSMNNILLIDQTDPNAVQITLVPQSS